MDILEAIGAFSEFFLSSQHGENYTYESFRNGNNFELIAFSKSDDSEKIPVLKVGVNHQNEQLYVPNVFVPQDLWYNGIGKKLIRIVYEVGRRDEYTTAVVMLTDRFREQLVRRGAIITDEYDTLLIGEKTRLVNL